MLAGALEMDELLWAAAVESLNGGEVPSEPVLRPRRRQGPGTRTGRVPAITAVGRRAGNLVAVYVGGEARRLGCGACRHRAPDRRSSRSSG